MKKSRAVPLALTALLAASLTGCTGGRDNPDNYAICVDPDTQERLDDDVCDDDRGHGYRGAHGGAWYYYGGIRSAGQSYRAPAVGETVSGGTFAKPSGTTQLGGVSRSGGTVADGSSAVSRGGFGGSGKSGGGG